MEMLGVEKVLKKSTDLFSKLRRNPVLTVVCVLQNIGFGYQLSKMKTLVSAQKSLIHRALPNTQ